MHNKPLRIVFLSIGILTISLISYYVIGLMRYSGVVDINYTREELTEKFNKHESQFGELISLFGSETKHIEGYSVTCKSSKSNRITLFLISDVINYGKSKQVGGSDMDMDSPKLDSALLMLGWKKETAIAIKDKLSEIGFDQVSIKAAGGNRPIFIYPSQSGWCSFEYKVYDKPLPDSISNRSISKSKLGRLVQLQYSCVF